MRSCDRAVGHEAEKCAKNLNFNRERNRDCCRYRETASARSRQHVYIHAHIIPLLLLSLYIYSCTYYYNSLTRSRSFYILLLYAYAWIYALHVPMVYTLYGRYRYIPGAYLTRTPRYRWLSHAGRKTYTIISRLGIEFVRTLCASIILCAGARRGKRNGKSRKLSNSFVNKHHARTVRTRRAP